ncbi:hypothetical protein ACFVJM_32450 [Streptomyces virginiae]|uniref:hypothetical protein n=1 Tax=Streptomyces virginiae TaxID=1961 RepID=UPI0036334B94
MIGPKKRWRAYEARMTELPDNLADLLGQSVADGMPIRDSVAGDPVEFADAFAQNHSDGGYVPARARRQLTEAIGRAPGDATAKA